MYLIVLIPFLLQTALITFDEYYFHVKRGLPKWERIGHPLDTLSVFSCFVFVWTVPYSPYALKWYMALCIGSCLLITKDEFVHKHHCPASEQWVHAVLFINHPILLYSLWLLWPILHGAEAPPWLDSWLSHREVLQGFVLFQAVTVFAFMLYQIIYWNFVWKEQK